MKIQNSHKLMAKDGTPLCPFCAKKMFNTVDSKEKKVSPYLWICNCKDFPKTQVLILG